jgi:HD superfamily phosphodiesterase
LKNQLEKETISSVVMIACNTSLSKEISSNDHIKNIKLDCVRDADRIDSLGAFGISRYLKYGITQKNNNLQNIIENLETRTSLLIPRIRTDYAKSILEKKLNLIKLFVEDYYQSI